MTSKERKDAAFSQTTTDKLMKVIGINAEYLFIPKRLLGSEDWLATQTETGQTVAQYEKLLTSSVERIQ
jgi:hypothetical protein